MFSPKKTLTAVYRRLSRDRRPATIEESRDTYLMTEAKRTPPTPRTLKRMQVISIAVAVAVVGSFVSIVVASQPQLVQHVHRCPGGLSGSPTWSPDGKYIAYAAGQCGTKIFAMPAAGGHARRITSGRGEQPAWSPNGRTILYRAPSGFSVLPARGGESRLLRSDDGDYGAAWSPNGSQIAFTHGRIGDRFALAFTSTLYVMNSDGSNVRRLLGHSCNPGTPAWARDGTRLAFTCDDGLYVERLSDGRLRRIGTGNYSKNANSTTAASASPSWSPDGRTIALASEFGIQLFRSDRIGKPKTIVEGSLFSAFSASWSPDGRKIAYSIASTQKDGGASIYVIDRDGRNSRLLVSF